MTLTISALIGCAVGFFVSTVVGCNIVGKLRKEMESEAVKNEQELKDCQYAMWWVGEAEYIINQPSNVPGAWDVVKSVMINDKRHWVAIKRFADEDEAYNRLCAEELLEMLNEK